MSTRPRLRRLPCLVLALLLVSGCGTGRAFGRAIATVAMGVAVAGLTHAPSAGWGDRDRPDPPSRDRSYVCTAGDASLTVDAFGFDGAEQRCEATLELPRGSCRCRPP